MTREEVIIEAAKLIFKHAHPDIKWGRCGTIDEGSWRSFEKQCLEVAKELLKLKRKCPECKGSGKIQVRDIKCGMLSELRNCPTCKGTGEVPNVLAILDKKQEVPECDLMKWDSAEQKNAYINGWEHATYFMTTPKDGTVWRKTITEEKNDTENSH